MRVIKPIAMTDGRLTSSTVPETDYATWVSGTTYSTGQKVIRTTTHRIYEALKSTTGMTPETSPEDWTDIGSTNRWAMFDDEVGSQTVKATSIVVTITPSTPVDSLAVLEIDGASVAISVVDEPGGTVVYSRTEDTDGTIITSFFDWFYAEWEPKTEIVFLGMPSWFPESVITLTITAKTGGDAKCGVCKMGTAINIGGVMYGAELGIEDYSKKEVNEFGRTVIVPRPWVKTLNCKMIFDKPYLQTVFRTLADITTTPSVWVASDVPGWETLTVFGFYRSFAIDVAYPTKLYCTLQVEGII